MKDQIEENAALEALAATTNATGVVDTTISPKIEESAEEKQSDHEEDEKKKNGDDEESKGSLRDYARIFSFSDRLDRCLYAVALLCSIGSGAALPLMVSTSTRLSLARYLAESHPRSENDGSLASRDTKHP